MVRGREKGGKNGRCLGGKGDEWVLADDVLALEQSSEQGRNVLTYLGYNTAQHSYFE